jgi:hypothetical protein
MPRLAAPVRLFNAHIRTLMNQINLGLLLVFRPAGVLVLAGRNRGY